MRTKKRTPDFGAISRASIKRDFQRVQRYPKEEKRPQIENPPEINAENGVVLFVHDRPVVAGNGTVDPSSGRRKDGTRR